MSQMWQTLDQISCMQRHVHICTTKSSPFSFTPCDRCLACLKNDQCTPSLFKPEFTGDDIVKLYSKTYFCFGQRKTKCSHKRLSKAQNSLTVSDFSQVLETQTSSGGVNTGFRTDGATIDTYSQHCVSLSFLYIKCKVHTDGVSTSPLAI